MPLPTFIEQQLPVLNHDFGTSGGPQWRTAVIELRNGVEQRNAEVDDPRREWSVGQRGMLENDLASLLDFHSMVRGAAIGFRFKDQADFRGTDQLLGVGDGTTTTFQLAKVYGDPVAQYVRTIKKPVAGTVTVKLNGVLQASGWSVDTTTGIITFASAPALGATVTASFEFDVPVRFKEDSIRHKFDTYTGDGRRWFTVSSVNLIELR